MKPSRFCYNDCRMMWSAGTVAAMSSITFPTISALVSHITDQGQQGKRISGLLLYYWDSVSWLHYAWNIILHIMFFYDHIFKNCMAKKGIHIFMVFYGQFMCENDWFLNASKTTFSQFVMECGCITLLLTLMDPWLWNTILLLNIAVIFYCWFIFFFFFFHQVFKWWKSFSINIFPAVN